MSQLPPDDRVDGVDLDPLAQFASEGGAHVADPKAPKTAVLSFEEAPPTAPTEVDELRACLQWTEQALEDAERELTAARAELATLVRAGGDIRSRPIAEPGPGSRSLAPLHHRKGIAAALVALIAAAIVWPLVPGGRAEVPPPAVEEVQAASGPEPAAEPPRAEPATPAEPEPGAPAAEPAPSPAAPPNTQAAAPAQPQPSPPPAQPSAQPSAPPARQASARPSPPPARQPSARPSAPRAQFVGTLSIDAEPGGATVFLNRERVGTTPLQLSGLRAGSHLVWIQREGYRRWTRVVLVPADQVTRVSAELQALDTR